MSTDHNELNNDTVYEDSEYFEEEETEESATQDTDELEEAGDYSRLQALKDLMVSYPRIGCGSTSLMAAFVIDCFARFNPLAVTLTLAGAITVGIKGEDIIQVLVPSIDLEEARAISSRMMSHLPDYRDQSLIAKIKRTFGRGPRELVEQEPVQQPVRQLSPARKTSSGSIAGQRQEGLTYDRIIAWFERGLIDDAQLIRLSEHLLGRIPQGTERARDCHAHVDIVEHEPAPQAAGPTQMETLRPARPDGWNEEKEQQLIGAYLTNGNYCKCLEILDFSDTQRNRDYAREILKKKGLLKGKS